MKNKTKAPKKKQAPLPVIYHVVWFDAVSHDEWDDQESHQKTAPHEIHSVGFCLEDTKEKIVLCLSLDTVSVQASNSITIPAGMVVSYKRVK